MPDLTRALALVLAAGLAMPAAAQDENGDAPLDEDDGVSLGEPVEQEREAADYIDAEFDDWQRRCFRIADQQDPCEMYQLIEDDEGFPVAEISVVPLPSGGEAVAGATIVTPLETLLTEQVTMQIDDGDVRRYPFSWCNAAGCMARVGFTDAELASLKRGLEIRMRIVPAAAPDQTVDLSVSLIGFTDAFDSIEPQAPRQQEMPQE